MQSTQYTAGMSRDEFVRNLDETGLFASEELQQILATLPEAASEEMVLTFARQLTDTGKLTPFQLERVLEGKGRDIKLGNYEILQRLGAGGMGTVFKARHRRMKRIVAIKVLAGGIAQDAKFLLRFQREVETVARLSHPNIVMAFDADEAETGPFLVMEFVNGRDLATRVHDRGPLPLGDAVDCILQAARGLAYAHSQGIVHRDIKPANLLQDVSGVVKVADLGLARLNDSLGREAEGTGSITQAGTVVGTVDYMPPEQAEDSTAIDHRADTYSLGCTLYFLLTGKPPYVAQSLMATMLKHRQAPIPSLVAARSDTPPALDALFQRLLAKQPAERCNTMDEVIRALEALPTLPVTAAAGEAGQSSLEAAVGPGTLDFSGFGELPAACGDTTTIGPGRHQDKEPSTEIPVLAAMKVLLVEPSRTQASIVRNYLQGVGVANVQTMVSGERALESARDSRPNVVISTMHLNDMTGLQLAKKMRGEPTTARIGFILIASEADASDVGTLHELPKTFLLAKPFTQVQLSNAIRLAMS
jgi:serine/threonine protein kinase